MCLTLVKAQVLQVFRFQVFPYLEVHHVLVRKNSIFSFKEKYTKRSAFECYCKEERWKKTCFEQPLEKKVFMNLKAYLHP